MNLFKDYFSEYVDNYQLSCLQDGEIVRFAVKREDRELIVVLHLNELVEYSVFKSAEESIKNKMNLRKVTITPRYISDLFDTSYIGSIIEYVKRKNTAVNGFFEGSETDFDGRNLKFSLKKGGSELLKTKKADSDIEKAIFEMFGFEVNVTFEETETFDIQKAVKEAVREKIEKEKEQKEEKIKNVKHTLLGDLPIYIDTAKVILADR